MSASCGPIQSYYASNSGGEGHQVQAMRTPFLLLELGKCLAPPLGCCEGNNLFWGGLVGHVGFSAVKEISCEMPDREIRFWLSRSQSAGLPHSSVSPLHAWVAAFSMSIAGLRALDTKASVIAHHALDAMLLHYDVSNSDRPNYCLWHTRLGQVGY